MFKGDLVDLLTTIVAPAAITLIAMAIAWRPWRRSGDRPEGYWGGAAGFALAYVVGHALFLGRVPDLPPKLAQDWVWLGAIVAGVLGLATSFARVPRVAAAAAALVVGLAQAWFVVRALRSQPWEQAWVGHAVWVGAGLLTAAAWWSLDTLAARARGGTIPACLWLALAVASVLFFKTYSVVTFMHLSGVIASACAVAAILGWWCPRVTVARGAALVAVVVFAGLTLVGWLFAGTDASPVPGLLAFLAVHGAWAGDLPRVRSLRGWQRTLVRLAAVGAILGVALAIGWPTDVAPDDPYGY